MLISASRPDDPLDRGAPTSSPTRSRSTRTRAQHPQVLEETHAWLRSRAYAAAYEWIDSGLDVAYDPEMRGDYRKLMVDDEFCRDLIERSSHEADRRANVDW